VTLAKRPWPKDNSVGGNADYANQGLVESPLSSETASACLNCASLPSIGTACSCGSCARSVRAQQLWVFWTSFRIRIAFERGRPTTCAPDPRPEERAEVFEFNWARLNSTVGWCELLNNRTVGPSLHISRVIFTSARPRLWTRRCAELIVTR